MPVALAKPCRHLLRQAAADPAEPVMMRCVAKGAPVGDCRRVAGFPPSGETHGIPVVFSCALHEHCRQRWRISLVGIRPGNKKTYGCEFPLDVKTPGSSGSQGGEGLRLLPGAIGSGAAKGRGGTNGLSGSRGRERGVGAVSVRADGVTPGLAGGHCWSATLPRWTRH